MNRRMFGRMENSKIKQYVWNEIKMVSTLERTIVGGYAKLFLFVMDFH